MARSGMHRETPGTRRGPVDTREPSRMVTSEPRACRVDVEVLSCKEPSREGRAGQPAEALHGPRCGARLRFPPVVWHVLAPGQMRLGGAQTSPVLQVGRSRLRGRCQDAGQSRDQQPVALWRPSSACRPPGRLAREHQAVVSVISRACACFPGDSWDWVEETRLP